MTPSPLQDVTAAAASARSMGVGWGARGGAADDAESTPSQSAGETTDTGEGVKKKKKTDRTSRQTQAGIGHSLPAHRGGHMQNRISRRQVRRGKIENSSEAEQPRTD